MFLNEACLIRAVALWWRACGICTLTLSPSVICPWSFLASLMRPESKWKQSVWSTHRLSLLATCFCCSSCGSLFSIFKNKLHSDSASYFKQGRPPPSSPSFNFLNSSVENPKNSILPVAVSEKGFLLVRSSLSQADGKGLWLGQGALSLDRAPGCSQQEGEASQPLFFLSDSVFCGCVGLKQLCLLSSSGFGRKSAGVVATFIPTSFSPASSGASVQAPTPPCPPTWVSVGRGPAQLLCATLTPGAKHRQVPVPKAGQGACGTYVCCSTSTAGRIWCQVLTVFIASYSCGVLDLCQSVAQWPMFERKEGSVFVMHWPVQMEASWFHVTSSSYLVDFIILILQKGKRGLWGVQGADPVST